jgi:hypothetical protein
MLSISVIPKFGETIIRHHTDTLQTYICINPFQNPGMVSIELKRFQRIAKTLLDRYQEPQLVTYMNVNHSTSIFQIKLHEHPDPTLITLENKLKQKLEHSLKAKITLSQKDQKTLIKTLDKILNHPSLPILLNQPLLREQLCSAVKFIFQLNKFINA